MVFARNRFSTLIMLVGALTLLVGVVGRTAWAEDDTANYVDRVESISGSRSFDADAGQTTFTFELALERDISHVVITSCPEGAAIVSATGPTGAKVEMGKDGSTKHTGAIFTPGQSGTYTVTFEGDVAGAELVTKEGNGHKHYSVGEGCTGTAADSTTTTTAAIPEDTTTTTTTTAGTEPTTTTTAVPDSTTTTTDAPAGAVDEDEDEEPTTTTSSGPTTTTAAPTTTTTAAPTTTTTAAPTITTTAAGGEGPRRQRDGSSQHPAR